MASRLPLNFHETIQLKKSSLTQVLSILAEINNSDNNLSLEDSLRQQADLGNNYIISIPNYGKGFGLINDNKTHLTVFGDFVLEYDPLFENPGTQWLMHYHMSSPHGPGPAFWHDLVTNYFRSGDTIKKEEVLRHIQEFYLEAENKPLAERSAKSASNIFLKTYTNSDDGLGKLGILESVNEKNYHVLDPQSPPTWVVAFALVDYWENKFTGLATINLNDLYGEGGLTGLFMIGRGRLNSILETCQSEGILEMYRIAPPYQVVLLNHQKEEILNRLYGLYQS